MTMELNEIEQFLQKQINEIDERSRWNRDHYFKLFDDNKKIIKILIELEKRIKNLEGNKFS